MRLLLSITCLIACVFPLACLGQYTEQEARAIAGLERKLKIDVVNDGINGSTSAVVIKNDKVIWAKAFGYANRDTKKLADTGAWIGQYQRCGGCKNTTS